MPRKRTTPPENVHSVAATVEAAEPEAPRKLTTEEVADWLTGKPKHGERKVFNDLCEEDPSWRKKAVEFRERWLEHVGGNVTSKQRAKEARQAEKEGGDDAPAA